MQTLTETQPPWFHGPITRNDAEKLLKDQGPGCFLVRVSESRVGYSLSYSAFDRCRHFMIEILPDGQFMIVGASESHRTLEELVKFHRRSPIFPFNEILTQPCERICSLPNEYGDLFECNTATKGNDIKCTNMTPTLHPGSLPCNPPVQNPGLTVPPAVPKRTHAVKNRPPLPPRANSCDSFPKGVPSMPFPAQNESVNRLYPSIPEEMKSPGFLEDVTPVSNLYPWKNKMKHSNSMDSLLFDQKSKKDTQMSASVSVLHLQKEVAASQQSSSDNNWKNNRHVSKLLKPAKEFKNKVLPVLGKAAYAIQDVKLPHVPKLNVGVNNKGNRVPVPKDTVEGIYSEPDDRSEEKSSTNRNSSSNIWNIQPQFTPGQARGGHVSRLNAGRPMEVRGGFPTEEYKRPPPYAPGF